MEDNNDNGFQLACC